jgi:2-keto-4-pentenoate hydratase/2-oxohepta-3-ene-1,7-dioic acid hydratase in catechol pathway
VILHSGQALEESGLRLVQYSVQGDTRLVVVIAAPVYLNDGDVVEVEIERIGRISNRVQRG